MGKLADPSPLSQQHEIADFSCGDPALDNWLKTHAVKAQDANTARVFVITQQNQVVGYYALASAALLTKELPSAQRKNLPRHPVPALLIARLAVDQRFQHMGIGNGMIQDAVLRAIQIQKQAGLVCVIANAKNAQAQDFYLKAGFELSPTREGLVSLFLISG